MRKEPIHYSILAHQLRQLRHVGRNALRLNSDTSHMAGIGIRRRNTNTPTVAAIKRPQRGSHACVAASVVMMDRALAQTEWLYWGPLHSQAT